MTSTLPKVRVKTGGTIVNIKSGKAIPKSKSATLIISNKSKIVPERKPSKVVRTVQKGMTNLSFIQNNKNCLLLLI